MVSIFRRTVAKLSQRRPSCGAIIDAPSLFGDRGTGMKSLIVKRSVVLNGSKTSVSLEEAFWDALREIARRWHVTPPELIEEINASRKGNLSSAIRLFVLEVYKHRITPPEPKGAVE